MNVAELLRSARERRGLTLEQVANDTKIGLDRLATFERDGLPRDGGFYERAQLRSYAEALGLDYRVVLEQLNRETLAAAPAVVPKPPAPPPRRIRVPRAAMMTAASVVLFAVIGTAWLRQEPRQSPPAPPASVRPPALRVVAVEPVAVAVEEPAVSVAATPATLPTSGVVERASPPVATMGVLSPTVPTSLVIVTEPEGARVTVDGIGWGTTPVTIASLSEGLKRIRVTIDGYVAVERAVEIQPARVNRLALQLTPVEPEAEQTVP